MNIKRIKERLLHSTPTNVNLKKSSILFALVLLTSLFIVSAIIALPRTELLSPELNFDLNLKDQKYSGQSYIIELNVKREDEKDTNKKVEQTKNVLHRRLDKLEAEVVKIENYTLSDEERAELNSADIENEAVSEEETGDDSGQADDSDYIKRYVKVSVHSTLDPEFLSQVIRSRSYLRIVTPKDGVDFNDPENQIAQYLPENYDDTPFTRRAFRNIEIKELPTATGETAFFTIYKVNPLRRGAFNRLLEQHAGKPVGINIDGFVTPYIVPAEFGPNSTTAATYNPDFAPAIANTPEQAEIADILLNSGVIPVEYEVIKEEAFNDSVSRVDYPTALLAILAGVIAVIVFIGWQNRKELRTNIIFIISTLFTVSLWLSLLKFFAIPVDLDMIVAVSFLLIFLIELFAYRSRGDYLFQLVVVLISLTAWVFGEGYVQNFAGHLFFTSVVAVLTVQLAGFYLDNMKRYVLR